MDLKAAGKEPNDIEKQWLKYGFELITGSSVILDDAAKFLTTLEASLLTIYIAALTFLKFNEKISTYYAILIIILIAIMILCIFCNIRIFFPTLRCINLASIEDIKYKTSLINQEKYNTLKLNTGIFALALLISVTSVVWISMPSQENVQFIISKDKVSSLDNTTIFLENNTQQTKQMQLVRKDDLSYLVKTTNGKKVELARDLIDCVIYVNYSN